ncbi:hypothetical protein RHCRD62_40078 [Rhodococcus sp. RD6.2]|nr:hypothetical protein RHCRD62_40078 [Rhodococcus sp. RD6.2]
MNAGTLTIANRRAGGVSLLRCSTRSPRRPPDSADSLSPWRDPWIPRLDLDLDRIAEAVVCSPPRACTRLSLGPNRAAIGSMMRGIGPARSSRGGICLRNRPRFQ